MYFLFFSKIEIYLLKKILLSINLLKISKFNINTLDWNLLSFK